MFTGHPPQVEHGIGLATEQEIVTVKLFAIRDITISNFRATLILELLPLKEILGIEFANIEFSKGNSFFKIKQRIVSTTHFYIL